MDTEIMNKDVSVIIPAYNAELLIGRCLDSIYSQITDYSIEIIVIDDGSTDQTKSIIKDRKEDNILLIEQKNEGPASARNKGIEYANGKYITFIDADDYWLPNFINKTVEFLNSNKNCIAVSVAQKHITLTKEIILPDLSDKDIVKSPFVINDFFSFWAKYNHICTGSIMMNANIVKSTGGQLVNLKICEDLEFWAYLSTFGKFGFIPEVLFVSDGTSITHKYGWRKKNLIRWKNAPTIKEWEQRCITRLPKPTPNSYLIARGKIALNTSICMILSRRTSLARNEVIEYGKTFPNHKLSKILKICAKNIILWELICFIIRLYNYYLDFK